MSKTPYEIRLDLLTLARNHLMGKFDAQYNWVRAELDRSNVPRAKWEEYMKENKPEYPDFSAILDLAESMKSFVDRS